MQYAPRTRMCEMNARVDIKRGLLVLTFTFEYVALGVQRKQVRCADLAPVQAIAIEQKPLAVGEHEAEVIADALVQVHARREAEGSGEIHPRRGDFELIH